MEDVKNEQEFKALQEALEPRAPSLVLDIEQHAPDHIDGRSWVRARTFDSLTCDELSVHRITPFQALRLLPDASRVAFDGEECEHNEARTILLNLCEYWHELAVEAIPDVQPVSCSLADAIQFVIDAHRRVNGRQLVVTIDGAHWSVM